MRKTTVTQKWTFGLGANTIQNFWVQQEENRLMTGARWMGNHGVVMEICKVACIHELLPTINDYDADEQLWMPGGYQLNTQVSSAYNKTGFLVNTIQLCFGRNSSVNVLEDAALQPNVIFSSKVINEAVQAAGTDQVSVTTREENTVNDLTDGAGNGLMVAVPFMSIEAWTTYGTQPIRAVTSSQKLLIPPFWSGEQSHKQGKTHIIVFYKYREVDYKTWTGLFQEQNGNLLG